ncbi:mucin-5AC-like [Hyalella azteca]|uniref:Mucin-5AC-like n=1 Tax=Hyalella azteca TaxID=294128 RepID=A0A8B7NYM5_HYAAZ|nr:mucin-5AC-like [Hyalella azteca]
MQHVPLRRCNSSVVYLTCYQDDMVHNQVPENELRKAVVDRVPSEAELRVRRSLQKLNIPDWMRDAPTPGEGFLLRRTSSNAQPPWGVAKPWDKGSTSSITDAGGGTTSGARLPRYNSTTTSPSSVAASPATSGAFQYGGGGVGGGGHPWSRWSTSRLSGGDTASASSRPASGTTTPTGSLFSQRSTASYGRSQPYLGWRSQTSLSGESGRYLGAAERLALTMPPHKLLTKSCSVDQSPKSTYQASPLPNTSTIRQDDSDYGGIPTTKQPTSSTSYRQPTSATTRQPTRSTTSSTPVLSISDHHSSSEDLKPPGCDIHSSIKEVTSAIVHYCTERYPRASSPRGGPGGTGDRRSPRHSNSDLRRSGSPRPVWVESSFVGSRPPDASPEATELPPLPHLVPPVVAPKDGGELRVS